MSARVPKPVRETLEEAAALSGATLNQFVVQAALKEAHAVLERELIIHLTRRDADQA
ncbi:MAG: type II toxin-antitoxin system TacA family antitoxin [Gammaproteobacteria bacterium]